MSSEVSLCLTQLDGVEGVIKHPNHLNLSHLQLKYWCIFSS